MKKKEHSKIKERKKLDKRTLKKLENVINRYEKNMKDKINGWYLNFGIDYGYSSDEAKKSVKNFDVELFKDRAKQIVDNREFSKEIDEQMSLYNLKMKESRMKYLLEDLKELANQMYLDLEDVYLDGLTEAAKQELKEQGGVLAEGTHITKSQMETLLKTDFKGDSFSNAIWKNKGLLVGVLSSEIPPLILSGAHPRTLATKLANLLDVEKWKAKRILLTETTKIQAKIQEDYYKKNNIKRYEFIAEATACSKCSRLNGKKFDVDDFAIGINAEPMHPNCRCTTVPVVE